jgi:hypothetical protein
MGTLLSYTTSPTLDQGPIGSRLTPRAIRAAASSRRRALRLLTRSVICEQRQGAAEGVGAGVVGVVAAGQEECVCILRYGHS